MAGDRKTYEDVNRHNLARADFVDVIGGPTREGCYKVSIAGPVDVAALKRAKQHLDLTIEFLEADAAEAPKPGASDAR